MAEKNQRTKPLLTAEDLQAMGEEGEFCEHHRRHRVGRRCALRFLLPGG